MSNDLSNGPKSTTPESISANRLLMVAVDGSAQATWAAQVAAGLAQPLGAEVVLVHVMSLQALGSSELAFTERELIAMRRRRADEVFASARALFPPTVRVQQLLREGDAGKEIIASAGEWGADLLVMGTHGRGRLATFLLGSTAEAVIRGAHCPVLTVAHDPRGTAPLQPDTTPARLPVMAV